MLESIGNFISTIADFVCGYPMFFTLIGMVMEVRRLQLEKACQPSSVTFSGILMVVRLEQPEKA